MKSVLLILIAALCGLAWGHDGLPQLVAFSVALPVAWSLAGSRWIAASSVLAFYLATARGLPEGTAVFFGESAPVWLGVVFWFVASCANALPWLLLWREKLARRIWGAPLALVLTAIPPLGIVGWTNPLTAAGLYFPEMGFIGLAMFLGLVAALVSRRLPAVLPFLVAAMVANAHAGIWPKTPELGRWMARDTAFGKLASGSTDFLAAYDRIMTVQEDAESLAAASVLVLPETLLGRYSQATENLLQPVSEALAAKGSTVLVGAEISNGYVLKNALVTIGADGGQALVQRMPVPVSMWKPWDNETFVADPFGSGVATVAGRRIAYLICYEQLLVWPAMISMSHSPSLLIGSANGWWARGTSIPAIQLHTLDLYGRLFAVPVIQARNL